MAYLNRILEQTIEQYLFKGKAVIIHGARQCGKTTMVSHLAEKHDPQAIWLNGDDYTTADLFSNITLAKWRAILGPHKTVIIDEAQMIPNVGRAVKLLIDSLKDVQIILTGSSSFQLANVTEEPLTGRKYEFQLFPLSFAELCNFHGFTTEYSWLEDRLLYGSYPELVLDSARRHEHLKELSESYLYRDILKYDGIRKSSVLRNLVKALALQIGSEVSTGELARLIGISRPTVETYLVLLEHSYVIFSLPSFSRNVRNELKKARKIYFWDTGIRNAVINDFSPLDSRQDSGHIWENYLIAERLKLNNYKDRYRLPDSFFWRTSQQQEIDYIEAQGKQLYAWEFKWQPSSRQAAPQIPLTFIRAYPEASTAQVDRGNYQDFLEAGSYGV